MGGDDSQKLLPWRGIYSPPGRKPPAHCRINMVTEPAVGILAGGTTTILGQSGRGFSHRPPGSFLESRGGMRSPGICGVCDSASEGEAAHEFLTPHILGGSEGGQEFIDRAKTAAAKMRVRHRFDGFQLLGWVCFQIHFGGLHLRVPEP
jgi:hypothetical protein